MIEMTIDSLRVGLMNPKAKDGTPYVILLKEKAGKRYLPLFVGPAEANAIAIKLRGEQLPRPLTHDFLCSTISALGASINYVVISDQKNDTFYAKTILNVNNNQLEIDCRPSDALNLALSSWTQVPIYADEKVMATDSVSVLGENNSEAEPEHLEDEKLKSFSDTVKDILGLIQREASNQSHGIIDSGRMLLALIDGSIISTEIIKGLGIDSNSIQSEIEPFVLSEIKDTKTGLTPAVKQAIQLALGEASKLCSKKLEPIHLLLGLTRSQGAAGELLRSKDINPEKIYIQLILSKES